MVSKDIPNFNGNLGDILIGCVMGDFIQIISLKVAISHELFNLTNGALNW